MTSPKKVEASRSNSLKSTGPKTSRGRHLSRFNAVKHGVSATHLLLPGEDEAEYKEMSAKFFDENQPVTTVERTIVELLVAGNWRIQRIARAQAAYFDETRRSLMVRTLRSMSYEEFEMAKSVVTDTELLRTAENARASQKLEVLAATFGLAKLKEEKPRNSPLSPDETDAMSVTLKRKLESGEMLGKLLLEGMASSENILIHNTLENARRAEQRDFIKNYANLLELQERRLTIEPARIEPNRSDPEP